MHWFGGSIAEAVNLSKQRNAIFVVFVEGDNDLSVEMSSTIDDTEIVTRLSNETNFLAVKLKSGSTNYTHFAQIYQFVPVPSLFFIGRNGTPLEVVCAGVQPANLASRIDRILEEHHKENNPIQPSTSSRNIREETVNFLQSETNIQSARANVDKSIDIPQDYISTAEKKPLDGETESSAPPAKVSKGDTEVVCVGDVCVRKPKTGNEPSTSHSHVAAPQPTADEEQKQVPMETESTESMEEKMERAKELIEARRREKADKEKEAEKQKEIDRRAQGQGVAELKRWQAEQELKQIQEERKREKAANNLARQRVLQQIAQDRAERRARDQPAAVPANTTTQHEVEPAPQAHTAGDSGGRARIQFKLPDGTSHTAHFDADGTLADVQQYIADNLQLSQSSFSLWMSFPRRELTESGSSLRELQLAPSAALLVLSRRAQPAGAEVRPVASLIAFFSQIITTLILDPTQQIYAWIRSRFFPPPAVTSRVFPPNPPAPSPPQPGLAGLRRRGNIHRLTSDRTPDDDNNTWNGNSTQQM